MTTLTRPQAQSTAAVGERPAASRSLPAVLSWPLRLLAGLAVALSMLPVIVLPWISAVPWYLCALLAAADAGLLVAAVRLGPGGTRLAALGGTVAVSVIAALLSQWFASTPPILGADGRPLSGSVAELAAVELNGRLQWITLRGHDVDKPVLLFLAGGPGGSQLAATRKHLGALEEHFVVVNWDQPGAAKSYLAADFATLSPETYIADGHALTQYLRERFGQERIYLLGESWGSLLGVWLVQRYPEDYAALVGVAQMVAFLETDRYDYALALDIARERGDVGKVRALERQGPPPYYGAGVARKAAEYLLYLSAYMNANPEIHTNYDTLGDLAAPEYGLYDKVNYVRGLLRVMDVLWPLLWEVDLREEAASLEVPVYLLEGRHDVNAPPALAEDYIQGLEAPHKEIIWFEHSGHSPWVEEAEKVVDVMVNTVLAQTAP
jgi:pimeloyl-ACP methyl ester carboxylesterase